MVMEKIRRSKKTMRVPLIVMTAILAFGLVGSYVIWSSPDTNDAVNNKQATPEKQISSLQSSIDALEKSLKDKPKDFTVLSSLANFRNQQADLYAQAGNQAKSSEVYTKALENYLSAYDNAPAELNKKGKADILIKAATCAWYGNQGNTADVLFKQAQSLVPNDYQTTANYVLFLALGKKDFKSAKAELVDFKASLKKEDPQLKNVDQLIKGIEELEKQTSKSKTSSNKQETTTNNEKKPTKE